DLYQAVYGRNADSPLPVIAARSPSDCFDAAIEAVRIALRHMTPVFLLTDGYLANAAEPWRIPDMDSYAPIETNDFDAERPRPAPGAPPLCERDPGTRGRPWIAPGTPGLMPRIGGLEKDIRTGQISYDADNRQAMTQLRADKVASGARFIPEQQVDIGAERG